MELKQYPPEEYKSSLWELFPKGDFWDKRKKDKISKENIFLNTLCAEIFEYEKIRNKLWKYSVPGLTNEALEEYERVLNLKPKGTKKERWDSVRSHFNNKRTQIERIRDTGNYFGQFLEVKQSKPLVFSASRCGERAWGINGRVVIIIRAKISPEKRNRFEKKIKEIIGAYYWPRFIYEGKT